MPTLDQAMLEQLYASVKDLHEKVSVLSEAEKRENRVKFAKGRMPTDPV